MHCGPYSYHHIPQAVNEAIILKEKNYQRYQEISYPVHFRFRFWIELDLQTCNPFSTLGGRYLGHIPHHGAIKVYSWARSALIETIFLGIITKSFFFYLVKDQCYLFRVDVM